jgi:hypothetical protein
MLPNPLGLLVTHRTPLISLALREIRVHAIANPVCTSVCNSNPEPRWSMVNHSGYRHSRCQQLEFPNPEYRGADPRLNATWTPLTSRPHATTSPHALCDRKSRDRDFNCRESFALGNPECQNPDSPDSCHLSLRQSTAPIRIGKSLLAISTCMQLLHSPTPICRYAMENGFYLRLKVKSSLLLPDPTVMRDFAILQFFQVVDSLPLESPSSKLFLFESSPSPVPLKSQGTIPPELLSTLILSKASRKSPCTRPSTTLNC